MNINPAYRTHELEYVLNQSGIRTLIAVRTVSRRRTTLAMISEVPASVPGGA